MQVAVPAAGSLRQTSRQRSSWRDRRWGCVPVACSKRLASGLCKTSAAGADFAGALFQSYVQEKDAGAAKAAENTALQEEVCFCYVHAFEAESCISLAEPMQLMNVL